MGKSSTLVFNEFSLDEISFNKVYSKEVAELKELTPAQIMACQFYLTRNENGMSLEDIAKQVGIHVRTLQRWKQTEAWKYYQEQRDPINMTQLNSTSCNIIAEQERQKLLQENQELKALFNTLDDDLRNYETKVKTLEEENLTLLVRIDELQSNLRELNALYYAQQYNNESKEIEVCSQDCCNYELCAKRVLIVGGITKFKALYRNIIEQKGGEFDYLDGYMKGGERVLDNKIKRCDMVLCPVDCNSHNACLSVKKLCKKHGKPYKMLTSSSVSGITEAMR